jgi:hypothetical protein
MKKLEGNEIVPGNDEKFDAPEGAEKFGALSQSQNIVPGDELHSMKKDIPRFVEEGNIGGRKVKPWWSPGRWVNRAGGFIKNAVGWKKTGVLTNNDANALKDASAFKNNANERNEERQSNFTGDAVNSIDKNKEREFKTINKRRALIEKKSGENSNAEQTPKEKQKGLFGKLYDFLSGSNHSAKENCDKSAGEQHFKGNESNEKRKSGMEKEEDDEEVVKSRREEGKSYDFRNDFNPFKEILDKSAGEQHSKDGESNVKRESEIEKEEDEGGLKNLNENSGQNEQSVNETGKNLEKGSISKNPEWKRSGISGYANNSFSNPKNEKSEMEIEEKNEFGIEENSNENSVENNAPESNKNVEKVNVNSKPKGKGARGGARWKKDHPMSNVRYPGPGTSDNPVDVAANLNKHYLRSGKPYGLDQDADKARRHDDPDVIMFPPGIGTANDPVDSDSIDYCLRNGKRFGLKKVELKDLGKVLKEISDGTKEDPGNRNQIGSPGDSKNPIVVDADPVPNPDLVELRDGKTYERVKMIKVEVETREDVDKLIETIKQETTKQENEEQEKEDPGSNLKFKVVIGIGMAAAAAGSTQVVNAIRGLAHAVDVYGTAGGEGLASTTTGVLNALGQGRDLFLNLAKSDFGAARSAVGALAGLAVAHPIVTTVVAVSIAAAGGYALYQYLQNRARESDIDIVGIPQEVQQ